MKAAKSTKSELEVELKKGLAENLVYYSWYSLWSTLWTKPTRRREYLIPDGIAFAGSWARFLGLFVYILAYLLNIVVLSEINDGELDRVLKCFRWKIVAPLLMLQPRVYCVMKELLEAPEEEEEEEDSLV